MNRSSGILMHISSLPGDYGIGTFGEEAFKFVDFLKKSGQKYWQILPLGQTGYGDSPYQSFSAFAGNPYFIDFKILEELGFLEKDDYYNLDYGIDENFIDYNKVYINKHKVLKKAFSNFKKKPDSKIEYFKRENSAWLEDYSLYMAVREHFNLVTWQRWDREIKFREKDAINRYKIMLEDKIEYFNFIQYMFFSQWNALKRYANNNGIKIIGDIPIYVAEDSADVWSKPRYFNLNEELSPITVAGCPPDSFSNTGQLWGNPIYDWKTLEQDEYVWWIDRVRESFKLYDVVRIDHFRGFAGFWEVPYGHNTAQYGWWSVGPRMKLFNAIEKKLGKINVIAEDLGLLTDDVIKLREETNFPGMKVLQFGFGGDDSIYLPHNYSENYVAYIGTHDNDTICGWFSEGASRFEIDRASKYLNITEQEGIAKGFIRGVLGSVAHLAIITMQDFLELGNEARMNKPSTFGNNWRWRVLREDINDSLAREIYDLTRLYGR